MNKIYYTYRSFEEFKGGRSYIGYRKCPTGKTPELDAYLGSYTDKSFNPTNKEILGVYDCKEEAMQAEIELHIQYDVAKNPHFANKARATSTRFCIGSHTEESRRKIGEAQRGEKHPLYGKTGENHPWHGKSHSEEAKEKMSEAKSGENNPMFGKHHSEEAKAKISEAKSGENNPMHGKTGKNNPSYIPRDWCHPLYGTVLQKSVSELVKIFPEQNLGRRNLSGVARGKRSHHKGWECLAN